MANWTEFHIQIHGFRADQKRILALFEQHKQRYDDEETPWLFNFTALVGREDDGDYFWSPNVWYRWNEQSLVTYGDMKWSPPLSIVAKFAELLPNLTFDVISTTEHELMEHWRSVAGQPPEQIEDLVIDVREQLVLRHWLKDGEAGMFSLMMPDSP